MNFNDLFVLSWTILLYIFLLKSQYNWMYELLCKNHVQQDVCFIKKQRQARYYRKMHF